MGKTRKHKLRNTSKTDPLGGQDEFEVVDNEFLVNALSPVDAVREQLLNVNIEEKLNGLQSLAVLSSSKDNVVAICRTDVVRIAAPMLCDPNQAVRDAAAGALRNLSVCGPELCEVLVEMDVLTPLHVLLAEYMRDVQWTPSFDQSMGGQLDLQSDIFLQAVNLLWNLCESTSVALDTFNQTGLLDGLIRCLDYKRFGQDIAISVAQCLLVVSENNPKSWNLLNEHVLALLSLLEITGEHGHAYLCNMIAGILCNVPALAAAYGENIISALARSLEVDHRDVLSATIRSLPSEKHNLNHSAPELEFNMDVIDEETDEAAAARRRRQELPTEADIVVRNMGYLLDAQRVAAEVITNLCSSSEDEWVDAGEDGATESECVVDVEVASSASSTTLHNRNELSVDVVEAIKTLAIVEKLWQRAHPLGDPTVQLLRETNVSLLMKAKNLRISSLICLQNLCNSLSAEDLGGVTAIYNVWVDLGQLVFKGPQDASVLEPLTSLMRAALEHLKANRELFSQMTQSDLQLILCGVRNCSMAEIRANWLRMLGTLGCLLPECLVKVIIAFIVKTCAKEDDVWTISEALDALMDMFADNEWEQIVVDLSLPHQIKELTNAFKTKIRQQRRELKERYPATQTVLINLERFGKYIEKQSTKPINGMAANIST